MVEANQSLSQTLLSDESRIQLSRAVFSAAQLEALKIINAGIVAEGRRPTSVMLKERRAMASALIQDRHAEFMAKAKSSGVVQSDLRRLYAKEALALLRELARRSKHMCNRKVAVAQAIPLNECHAQNGAVK